MTTADDAIRKAHHLNKQLAARLLVTVKELTAEVEEAQRALAGIPEADHEAHGRAQMRLDELTEKLDVTRAEYHATIEELEKLKQLHRDAGRVASVATVQAARGQSEVDRTLARVREHADALDAEVALNAEMAKAKRNAPTEESAEDKARRQLDELKAARKPK